MTDDDTRWRTAVEMHCERYLGKCPGVYHEIVPGDVHIDLYPYVSADRITVVTCGVSEMPTAAPADEPELRHIELMCYLPADWDVGAWGAEGPERERWWWPGRMLKEIGRYVHAYDTWLAPGQTVHLREPDEPLAPGTQITGGVLLFPVFEDDAFGRLSVDGRLCSFLCVLPLTARELAYQLDHGTHELLDRLDHAGVDALVNPGRPGAV